MLKKIETGKTLDKEEYKKNIKDYEIELGILQRKLKDLQIPTLVLFEGWDAAGKGTIINNIIMLLDPRGFKVHAINAPNDEERLRPYLWKFWQKLPAKGQMFFFDKSWYDKIVENKVEGKIKNKEVNELYEDVNNFEKQLVDYGYLIVKFFLHIDKKTQESRFKKLEDNKATSWRVTKEDWEHNKEYDKFLETYDDMFFKTCPNYAAWNVIDASDERFATIEIIKRLVGFFKEKINEKESPSKIKEIVTLEEIKGSILDTVDLTKAITKEEYKEKLD
ncbi:MAG TPA: phosphate--AMP phosphotransferase, partial [Spirochaetota bacterium]|nr:phosphate--AMP phosphotransferase [Spirochaetota bacterium]